MLKDYGHVIHEEKQEFTRNIAVFSFLAKYI